MAAWGRGADGVERYVEESVGKLLERSVVRRLAVPQGVAIVAVGGSTLGGSGKTPLAVACAAELARAGARVTLVGHAYRASPGRARWVAPDDALGEVGDEALLAARALASLGGGVVVAPSRADAFALAARAADVLVVDGVAQLTPLPATLALLAVDGWAPWGRPAWTLLSGLRAPVATLVSACDAIVPMADVRDGFGRRSADDTTGAGPYLSDREVKNGGKGLPREMWTARVESRGACDDRGALLTWDAMRSLRVGLVAALGRPERLVRWLGRRGVFPRVVLHGRNHGPFGSGARRAARGAGARGIDVWLATPKCALHAADARGGLPGLTPLVLEHAVALHPTLRNRLRDIAAAAALTGEEGTNSLELLDSTSQVRSRAAACGPSAPPLAASGPLTMMMRRRA